MGGQEIIIYRLLMQEIDVMMIIFNSLFFWITFGGKMGVAAMGAHKNMGPQNPTKKSAHWLHFLG